MKSIKDVARLAGVSIATVSRYINSPEQVRAQTAKKVAEAIEKTGYKTNFLARNFRMGKTQQIVVVLPSVGIPFYGPILKGLRDVAEAADYHILVMETNYNLMEFDDVTRLLMNKAADGIILLSTFSPFKAEDEESEKQKGHPPIVMGLESISKDQSHLPCICIDNKSAARDATNYLIDLGHKDIGFFFGNIGYFDGKPRPEPRLTKERADGFELAMQERGLEVNASWVIKTTISVEGGQKAAQQLLAQAQRPTAIFCANDEMALGAMFEFKRAGLRIPEDISVMGFDNMHYGKISDPPLTTVEQPAELIGERSMRCLLKLIAGEKLDKTQEFVPHSIIKRETCRQL